MDSLLENTLKTRTPAVNQDILKTKSYLYTSEMIGLSKQQTADLLTCYGTPQDLSWCTITRALTIDDTQVDNSSPEIAKNHVYQPFPQPGQLMRLHMHVLSFIPK